jgi:N-acetyl-gamma-glutamyl-phosphate reductase
MGPPSAPDSRATAAATTAAAPAAATRTGGVGDTGVGDRAGRISVGVLGASGFVGGELLRLLAEHPTFAVVVATAERRAGATVAEVHPNLADAYPGLELVPTDPAACEGLGVVFLALPHGHSSELVPELLHRVGLVVDLGADFRLRDASAYPAWYGREHPAPELLATAVHGIPELCRPALPGARLVAAAGCYVTAAALALAPLVRAGAIETTGVIVDAASGVSGAGAEATDATRFCAVDGSMVAYGLLTHRHTPEIEQATGARVLFTPHLAPMSRGILSTCYARATGGSDPLQVLGEFYADAPFVRVAETSPSTKATHGSNCAHLSARLDRRTGWVLVLSALDNLVKGAAGQAIQCANLALGLPEGCGLPTTGMWP